jgi:hypothetical protein
MRLLKPDNADAWEFYEAVRTSMNVELGGGGVSRCEDEIKEEFATLEVYAVANENADIGATLACSRHLDRHCRSFASCLSCHSRILLSSLLAWSMRSNMRRDLTSVHSSGVRLRRRLPASYLSIRAFLFHVLPRPMLSLRS